MWFFTLIFAIPVVAIITSHFQKMAEIKSRSDGGPNGQSILSELQDMKRQIAELRDTTTRYDMSFDSALQRTDAQLQSMNERLTSVESARQSITR
jgi:hypothetical protein